MEYSDDELKVYVARAQEGDDEAVTLLFEQLSDRIFRYLRFRVSDTETAEDLTQTVFVEMLQSLPRYRDQQGTKFSTWLFQIARFRLIDHYRKHRSTAPIDDVPEHTHPNLRVDPTPVEDTRTIDAAIRQLPEKWQTLLHLRFREDLSTQDIADILKTTERNVRVMQHRALKALRSLLNNDQ